MCGSKDVNLIIRLNAEACWPEQQVLCQEGSGQNVTGPFAALQKKVIGQQIQPIFSLSLHWSVKA